MNSRLGELDRQPSWANEPSESPPAASSTPAAPPASATPDWSKDSAASPADVDVEMGASKPAPSAKVQESRPSTTTRFMATFFEDVDLIKSDIAAIRNATIKIEEIKEEAIMATTSEKERELSQKLTPLVMDTNKRAKHAKTLLGAVKEDNEQVRAFIPYEIHCVWPCETICVWRCMCGLVHTMCAFLWPLFTHVPPQTKASGKVKPSELRIRVNLCSTLTRKFIDEMKNYQKAQQSYKNDIKSKVQRQVKIVKPDATPEEVDQVMKSEGGRDQLYKEKILRGVNGAIKNTYANVADKYQDVLTLEASVSELHQMFLDFALLTEQQGEMLDQIEYQVKSAGDYIDDGNIDIQSAINYQRAIRKKQCCILVIVMVVAIILCMSFGVFK